MTFNINVNINLKDTDKIIELLHLLIKNQKQEAMTTDDILAKVTAQNTVTDSALALLSTIKSELDAAGTDPAKLQAIGDLLDKESQKIADAIVANTPAAPTPPAQ